MRKKSVGMPCKVGERAVDEHKEEYHEKQIGGKSHPLGKRTRYKRRRDYGKLHLKQRIQCEWNGSSSENLAGGCGVDCSPYVLKHGECTGISDYSAYVVAKAKAESEGYPQHGNDSPWL